MKVSTKQTWDIIIIGGGLAGSIVASKLGKNGQSVLVLEAGTAEPPAFGGGGLLKKVMNRIKNGTKGTPLPYRWPHTMDYTSKANKPAREVKTILGFGPGGSSTIYGAALCRFRRRDFEQNDTRHIIGNDPVTMGFLPNKWPIDFKEFSSYYDQAEALMRVRGGMDPLDPDDITPLLPPEKICPKNAALVEILQANGKHPFPLHVGNDGLQGCIECQGFRCARGCKADGNSRALEAAITSNLITFKTNVAVHQVVKTNNGYIVETIQLDPSRPGESIANGTIEKHNASQVVFAAGALNTPLILERSKSLWNDTPPSLLGRGLMFHITDFFAVFNKSDEPSFGPQKVIGLRDFYEIDGIPHGEVQSLGMPISASLIGTYLKDEAVKLGLNWLGLGLEGLRIPAVIASHWFSNTTLFATIIEDYPSRYNRVQDAAPNSPLGRIAITYKPSIELKARARKMRAKVKTAFVPQRTVFVSRPLTPNWGHPMGTCRMGKDPSQSVTDPLGRIWGQPGLWVTDASVFPSSAGTNPGLTIVANSLRVADNIINELKGTSIS